MTSGDDCYAVSRHPPTLHHSAELPLPPRFHDTAASLQRAMDAGRVGAWHVNLATREVVVTDTCKANFGLTPEDEFTMERGLAAIHEEDRPRVQRALDDAVAGAGEYDIEYRVIWPGGSVHWIHARGRTTGEPHCLHGVTVDITRPRQAEALALVQNAVLELVATGRPRSECLHSLNRAVGSLAPRVRGCFVLTDPQRQHVIEAVTQLPADAVEFLFALPVELADYGTCTAAIVHSRPFSCVDLAGDTAWQRDWRERCLSFGVRATYSLPVLRPQDGNAIGSFCLCLEDARPTTEWEQQIAVFASQIASMLVERDRAIEALHAGEARLAGELADARTLHEVSVELVGEDDDAALYERIVDAACTIMHSQFASMQVRHGSRLQLLAHRGFSPRAVEAWQWLEIDCGTSCGQALASGRRTVYADVRTSPIDRIVAETYQETGIIAVQSTPLKSRSGRIVGMLSTHWAHPHHPSEDELRLLDILARLAADLIERRQSDAELRESDRRKDEFLAMLGHELRNPLAPLRNGLHILRMEGNASADDRALYEMMDRQLTQLIRLVDDLLEVSRITRGHIELRRRHTALSDVVTTAVETSRPLLDAYGHRFSLELPDDPVVLDVDPIRIAQVLSNLLNNAAKYTGAGGRIVLRAQLAGAVARISVIDNGAGVDPRDQTEIFELFTRGAQTRFQATGGLGLGLTLARNLVLLHGGTLSVQSEGAGKGSEFIVELPLPDSRDAVQDAQGPGIAASGAPRRILIVDDNTAHAESLARVLAQGKHETHAVYDGYDALAVFESIAPEIVLLDLGMPGMDGYELCRRIRALPGGRDAAIIAVTGWGQQIDRTRTAAFGFDDHLVKPVNPADFLQRLARA